MQNDAIKACKKVSKKHAKTMLKKRAKRRAKKRAEKACRIQIIRGPEDYMTLYILCTRARKAPKCPGFSRGGGGWGAARHREYVHDKPRSGPAAPQGSANTPREILRLVFHLSIN